MEENMVDEDKMPQRWEMPLSCDYRPAANGDWVRVEDVEPLVGENARLRTRVSELESVLMLLCDRNYGFPSPLHIGEWSKAICAAKLLLEAKP
jgi:hypothetical protein